MVKVTIKSSIENPFSNNCFSYTLQLMGNPIYFCSILENFKEAVSRAMMCVGQITFVLDQRKLYIWGMATTALGIDIILYWKIVSLKSVLNETLNCLVKLSEHIVKRKRNNSK